MKFKATLRIEVAVTLEAPSQAEAERLAENVSTRALEMSVPQSPTRDGQFFRITRVMPVDPDDVEVIDVSPSPRSA